MASTLAKAHSKSANQKHGIRPMRKSGNIKVNTTASQSTPTKHRPQSIKQTKSPARLPRVATLPSPVRRTFQDTTPSPSKPPKSPFALPPRASPPTARTPVHPLLLSPRDGPRCPTPYQPDLHGSRGACERCLELASDEEKEEFANKGHHLRIMVVSGGCDRGCLIYPRDESQPPVRLCKKCYFDVHRTMYDSQEVVVKTVDR